ncbi:hypothetical protein LINPERHAP1_LOCUS35277 [Linum perenne]
MGGYSA